MSPEQKAASLWFFALFFHGEDFVTDDLSPYIDAAPIEAQTYFLTTQQVDEARHSVFFKRFLHEVVGVGDGSAGSVLAETESLLTWGHRAMFDHLGKVAARLRHDHSPAMFAEALFNYHIIVEGTLAQPGQHMLEEWLEQTDLLPGFREGMHRVSQDEQRHIAFGVKALSELYADDPEGVGQRIAATMRTTSQFLTDFAYPVNGDHDFVKPLGVTGRLRGIGLSEQHQRQALPIGPDETFEEQGERMLRLLEAGYFGEGKLPKSHDPEDIELYFTVLSNTLAANGPDEGVAVQFAFTDVAPRYLAATGDGTAESAVGTHSSPTITLTASFDDFLDVVAQRVNPVKLVLLRRLKVKGDLRVLVGKNAVFGPATAQTEPPLARLRARFA